ncbi:hypothetical protein D3C84_871220 [compost metagenome]
MASYILVCSDGSVTVDAGGAPLCSGAWALSPASDPFVVDAAAIAAVSIAFSAGFGLVLSVWAMSVGFKAVLSLLR